MSAGFITRVELHHKNNYSELHEAMRAEGFSTIIKMDSGKWYRLPTAEYYIECEGTTRDIVQRARAAVDSIGDSNATILVTKASNIRGHNLGEARLTSTGARILRSTRPG